MRTMSDSSWTIQGSTAIQAVLPSVPVTKLAGQLRESSRVMYKRDIAASATSAQQERLDPLQAATFAHRRTALAAHPCGYCGYLALNAPPVRSSGLAVGGLLSQGRVLSFQMGDAFFCCHGLILGLSHVSCYQGQRGVDPSRHQV
jgi:hypothetical protein